MNAKKIIFLVVLIFVVVVLALLFTQFAGPRQPRSQAPVTPSPAEADLSQAASDKTENIERDLGTIDLGNLDAEFQAVDADLNSL